MIIALLWFTFIIMVLVYEVTVIAKDLKLHKYKDLIPTYTGLIFCFLVFFPLGLTVVCLGNNYLEKSLINDDTIGYKKVSGEVYYEPIRVPDGDRHDFDYLPSVTYIVDNKEYTWQGFRVFTMVDIAWDKSETVDVYYKVDKPSKGVAPDLIIKDECELYIFWGTFHLWTGIIFFVLILLKVFFEIILGKLVVGIIVVNMAKKQQIKENENNIFR